MLFLFLNEVRHSINWIGGISGMLKTVLICGKRVGFDKQTI